MKTLSIKCLILVGLSVIGSGVSRAEGKKNFLFILADDLGYMDVGFNNSKTFYETPNLDRLASSGMIFSDFYAACQVCSPTRASIMTGKAPARTVTTNYFSGMREGKFLPALYETELSTDEVTIAEALKDKGYRTFFTGKWHLGEKGNLPTDQGFEINRGGGGNGAPKSYFSPYKNVENLSPGPDGEFLTDRLAAESAAFLETCAQQKESFLLYLSFYMVHTPLQAPAELIEKYKAKAAKMGRTDSKDSFVVGKERQILPEAKEQLKVRVRQDHAVYAAMVESLDTAVGKVLDRLEELGLKDDTVVVFTSDNGGLSTSEGHPTSNLPLRAGKGWMYEGGIREPMVVRWPGVTPPGTICAVPAITMDFYPTMLEIAGIEPMKDQHVDGVSLVPVLKNPFAKFDRGPLFFHYPHYSNQGGFPASAMRSGDFKLIQDLEDGEFELYNLKEDISEHNNISQLEAEKVKEMAAELDAWRKEVKARPLRPNPVNKDKMPFQW